MSRGSHGPRRSPLLGEGIRMAILSGASFVTGYLLTAALVELGRLEPGIAYAIAAVSCSIMNFFGYRHFVFLGVRGQFWREAKLFFPSVAVFRGLEILAFTALVPLLHGYQVTYVLVAGTSVAAKFIVSKWLIFRR